VDDARALEFADAADATAVDSLRIAREEFVHGQVGSLAVQAAQAASSQAHVVLVQVRAARYLDTVALFEALGGGWVSGDSAPASGATKP